MKCYSGSGLGRTFLLELDRGELIVESIEKVLQENNVKNAYIASGIGSVQHVEFHRPTTLSEVTEDEFLSFDQPFELGGISGTIIDGVAHLHFSMGSKDSLQIGHLEYGTKVLYLAELLIVEISGVSLKRVMTKEKVRKLFPISETTV